MMDQIFDYISQNRTILGMTLAIVAVIEMTMIVALLIVQLSHNVDVAQFPVMQRF